MSDGFGHSNKYQKNVGWAWVLKQNVKKMSCRIGRSQKMSKKCRAGVGAQNKCQKNVGRAWVSPKNVRNKVGRVGTSKTNVRQRSGGLRCPQNRSGQGQSSPHSVNERSLRRSIARVPPHIKSLFPKCPIRKRYESRMICMYGYAAHTNDANPMARSNLCHLLCGALITQTPLVLYWGSPPLNPLALHLYSGGVARRRARPVGGGRGAAHRGARRGRGRPQGKRMIVACD